MEGIKRRHLGNEAWRELFVRHAGSGESISEFCRREGVSTHSFRRWKLRLGEREAGDAGSLSSMVKPESARPVASAPFVDLGPLAAAASPAAGRLELRLELGGGVTLHLVRG